MTSKEQYKTLKELINTGKKLIVNSSSSRKELSGILVQQAEFELWMGQINTFNTRYLKNHPQYRTIDTKFFHRRNYTYCCEEMIGILQSVYNDEEFWKDSINENIDSEKILRENKRGDTSLMQHIIFISHRSIDAEVTEMVKDYLVETGIPNEYVFCSSLPGNDVKHQISVEVREKMKNSTINIAILSRDYYESAYCLNEAGVIWMQDSVPAITIGLPEVTPEKMYGFLNGDNKLRRLDNSDDIAAIYDIIQKGVGAKQASMAIANAASKKLISRYQTYLSKRNAPCQKETEDTPFSIENITTDDEKILLYYIISKKTRKISKKSFLDWIVQNELFEINIDNAFDLLSSVGRGKIIDNTLELDIELFRKCTSTSQKLIIELEPIYKNNQKLSSLRFLSMWENKNFNDEDLLFIAYIVQNRVTSFGTRWMEQGQLEDVRQWELNNLIDGSLSSTYSACLNLFVENRLVYPNSWTSYGNVREYVLFPSLRSLLLDKDFVYMEELNKVMDRHSEQIPF